MWLYRGHACTVTVLLCTHHKGITKREERPCIPVFPLEGGLECNLKYSASVRISQLGIVRACFLGIIRVKVTGALPCMIISSALLTRSFADKGFSLPIEPAVRWWCHSLAPGTLIQSAHTTTIQTHERASLRGGLGAYLAETRKQNS
jgi:hypothetical protein